MKFDKEMFYEVGCVGLDRNLAKIVQVASFSSNEDDDLIFFCLALAELGQNMELDSVKLFPRVYCMIRREFNSVFRPAFSLPSNREIRETMPISAKKLIDMVMRKRVRNPYERASHWEADNGNH